MPNRRRLRILFPLRTASDLAVPPTFIATGLVRAPEVRRIRARVREYIDGTPSGGWQSGTTIHFLPVTLKGRALRGRRRRQVPLFRWVARFANVTSEDGGIQQFLLRVEGLDEVGDFISGVADQIDVYIHTLLEMGTPVLVPAYDFPPNEYLISGSERDYFVAFGSVEANKPVSSAAIDGVAAASYFTDPMGWTWWAEFTGLTEDPGPTPQNEFVSLVVSNTDGAGVRDVAIEPDDGTEAPEQLEFPSP